MDASKAGFRARAARAAQDERLAQVVRTVAERFGKAREARFAELGNFAELRDRMNRIKETVLADHAKYLDQVRDQVIAHGGQVHFARDAAEARRIIVGIAQAAGAKLAVKSKSMTSEEIQINPALEAAGIEVAETDLGEYIIQLAHEPPFHIVVPAIHKTRAEIAELFADKLGMTYSAAPEALTQKAREVLREKFLAADLGLTGANAIVAENGVIVLFENEGNIRLTTTLPRIHVALVGIEKIVPTMSDLAVLFKLLPRSATGQKLSAYVSLIRAPRQPADRDGPTEFHLVLLDNGRGRMLADPLLREALKCIRCGACINVCPVFQHIGGHAYGAVYPGPIGAMITESLAPGREGRQLPAASSLCGACTEVCAAKIPIHKILLELRERYAQGKVERVMFRAWSEIWSRPVAYRLSNQAAAIASQLLAHEGFLRALPPPGNAWTRSRDFPAPAKSMFRKEWTRHSSAFTPGARPGRDLSLPSPANKVETSPGKTVAAPRSGDPDQLARELEALGGTVLRATGKAEARARLKEALAEFQGRRLVSWTHPDLKELGLAEIAHDLGMEFAWLRPGADPEALKATAAGAAVGVTGADYALAPLGTLVLLTRAGHDRSLSLLPPVHLAVLRAEHILADHDDLFASLAKANPADFQGLTLITGPSRTADIELVPVIGVHGPKRLTAIIWESA